MNLLLDPTFRTQTDDGPVRLDLPDLFEAFARDRVVSLPGLQRHQEDAFHIFLCYLAGTVLVREGLSKPDQDAAFWREGLHRLGGGDDAWTLVVDDPTRPAFMQPPLLDAAKFKAFKPKAATPDALDVLQLAKNHDVKMARAGVAEPDEWIYSLISLQTASGYSGKGNFGIARMNSGSGSRPCIATLYSDRPGQRWRRDLGILLDIRQDLLAPPRPYRQDGHVLLWCLPWDGEASLGITALDPFYIEVARLVRLEKGDDDLIRALGAPAGAARIAGKELKGNVGDPWTPINQQTGGALTVAESGLTPSLLRKLIFGDGFEKAPMQRIDQGDETCWFYAAVLVRGQGKTEGFHEARIPIPPPARMTLFRQEAALDRLSKLSEWGIKASGDMQNRVLRPALYSLLEGGPEQIDYQKREVSAWVDQNARSFARAWGERYFHWLWQVPEQPDDSVCERRWFEILHRIARTTLNNALTRVPLRHGRSHRARVKAEAFFGGALRKHFSEFMEDADERAA